MAEFLDSPPPLCYHVHRHLRRTAGFRGPLRIGEITSASVPMLLSTACFFLLCYFLSRFFLSCFFTVVLLYCRDHGWA